MRVPGLETVSYRDDSIEGAPKEVFFGGLSITTEGFGGIAKRCGSLDLPVLIVQEGGYLCPELADNLISFLHGINNDSRARPIRPD